MNKTVFRIEVSQTRVNDCGEWIDQSFTEYRETWEGVSAVVKRVDCTGYEEQYQVTKIVISPVWILP